MTFKKFISYVFFFNLSIFGMGLFAASAHAGLVDTGLETRLTELCEAIENETSTDNVSPTCLETLGDCEAKILENLSNISLEDARADRGRIIPGDLVPADPLEAVAAARERFENQLNRAIEKFREKVIRDCQPLPPPAAPVNPPVVDNNDEVADQIVTGDNQVAAEGKGGCALGSGIGGSVNYLYLIGMLLPLLGLRRK